MPTSTRRPEDAWLPSAVSSVTVSVAEDRRRHTGPEHDVVGLVERPDGDEHVVVALQPGLVEAALVEPGQALGVELDAPPRVGAGEPGVPLAPGDSSVASRLTSPSASSPPREITNPAAARAATAAAAAVSAARGAAARCAAAPGAAGRPGRPRRTGPRCGFGGDGGDDGVLEVGAGLGPDGVVSRAAPSTRRGRPASRSSTSTPSSPAR